MPHISLSPLMSGWDHNMYDQNDIIFCSPVCVSAMVLMYHAYEELEIFALETVKKYDFTYALVTNVKKCSVYWNVCSLWSILLLFYKQYVQCNLWEI